MSTSLQVLPKKENKGLITIAKRIRSLSQTVSSAVIDIGRSLIRAKEISDHGEFIPWVNAECGFTIRSAQSHMRVAKFARGKSESLQAEHSVLPADPSLPTGSIREVTPHTSIDFLADTEGPMQGIPNFLRRPWPGISTSGEKDHAPDQCRHCDRSSQ